jgi:hypothetical protein
VPEGQALAVALLWSLSTVIMGLLGGLLFVADRQPTGATSEPSR